MMSLVSPLWFCFHSQQMLSYPMLVWLMVSAQCCWSACCANVSCWHCSLGHTVYSNTTVHDFQKFLCNYHCMSLCARAHCVLWCYCCTIDRDFSTSACHCVPGHTVYSRVTATPLTGISLPVHVTVCQGTLCTLVLLLHH